LDVFIRGVSSLRTRSGMDTRPTAVLAPLNEPLACESTVAASALPAQSKLLVCHLWPIEHRL